MPIMTSHIPKIEVLFPKIEVLSRPERRRRWSTAEKLAIVQETTSLMSRSASLLDVMAFSQTSCSLGASSQHRVR